MHKDIYKFLAIVSLLLTTSEAFSSHIQKVYVLGTVHDTHLQKKFKYSLSDLSNQIKKLKPDLICGEIYDIHFNKTLEGIYPLENQVIIHTAKLIKAEFIPVDWRGNYFDIVNIEKKMTPEEKKRFDGSHKRVFELFGNQKSGFFEFFHSKKLQKAVLDAHDVHLKEGTDIAAGFWHARNQIVVKNCIRRALNDPKFMTVLFTFGVEHKGLIEHYLQFFYEIQASPIVKLYSHSNKPLDKAVINHWKKNRNNLINALKTSKISEIDRKLIESSNRISKLDKFIKMEGKAE